MKATLAVVLLAAGLLIVAYAALDTFPAVQAVWARP